MHSAIVGKVISVVWRGTVREPKAGGISKVQMEAQKATIDAEVDAGQELLVFIGDGTLGWSFSQPGAAAVTATVEPSSGLRLDDGSLGKGFVIRTSGGVANVAITPGGPVPFGEFVIRPASAVSSSDGIYTVADIHQPDGTRVPVSVRIRARKVPQPSAQAAINNEAPIRTGPVFPYTISGRTTVGKPLEVGGFADVIVKFHGAGPSQSEVLPIVRGAKVTKITDNDPSISNDCLVELELTQAEVDLTKLHAYRHSFYFARVDAPLELEKLPKPGSIINVPAINEAVHSQLPGKPDAKRLASFSPTLNPSPGEYVLNSFLAEPRHVALAEIAFVDERYSTAYTISQLGFYFASPDGAVNQGDVVTWSIGNVTDGEGAWLFRIKRGAGIPKFEAVARIGGKGKSFADIPRVKGRIDNPERGADTTLDPATTKWVHVRPERSYFVSPSDWSAGEWHSLKLFEAQDDNGKVLGHIRLKLLVRPMLPEAKYPWKETPYFRNGDWEKDKELMSVIGEPSEKVAPESPPAPENAPPEKPAAKLYRREVREKARDGRDIVMIFEELQRDEKTSIVTVKSVGGGSVGSAMFDVRGNYEIAKARGAACFINLKAWEGEDGAWMYLTGFAPNKDVDPTTYFDQIEHLPAEKRHQFLSVKDYEPLFNRQP